MFLAPLVPLTIPESLHQAAVGVAMVGMLILAIYSICHMGKRRPPYKTPRPWPWMFYPVYTLTVLSWIDVLVVHGRFPRMGELSPVEVAIGLVLVLVISLLTQIGKQMDYNEKQQATKLEAEPC